MHNLFEILSLPTGFDLNLKALEQAYFKAQRLHHPDMLVGKPEAERIKAIEQSQLVNEAYDTLKNPLTRAEHLLDLNGAVMGEPSPDILAEMMELRERIHDSSGDGRALLNEVGDIKAMAAACTKSLEEAFADNDYTSAAKETIRLSYLGKAMEEAHMLLYQFKARHG